MISPLHSDQMEYYEAVYYYETEQREIQKQNEAQSGSNMVDVRGLT